MSPEEEIPVLGKGMQNLALGDSSASNSGVASSQFINVRSNAEGAGNKSETGLSRILCAWLVNLSVTCLYICIPFSWMDKEDSTESWNKYLQFKNHTRL